jgi:hypothetical protein
VTSPARRGSPPFTPELLGDIRKSMPIDFSKRRPFFLRTDLALSEAQRDCDRSAGVTLRLLAFGSSPAIILRPW